MVTAAMMANTEVPDHNTISGLNMMGRRGCVTDGLGVSMLISRFLVPARGGALRLATATRRVIGCNILQHPLQKHFEGIDFAG